MVTTHDAEIAVHDAIEIVGRRVGDVSRVGEILEIAGEPEHRHYRIRWDDGHESMFYPGRDTSIRRSETRTSERKPATAQLVATLREAGVDFELLPHRRTQTAAAEARALGLLPQHVAKTVLVRVDGGCVRAVVPASRRLSLDALGDALGSPARLLSESELAGSYPEFELGAVPPFGGPEGDQVVVDAAVGAETYVVLEAGVHDVSLRLRSQDLVEVTHALVAGITTG